MKALPLTSYSLLPCLSSTRSLQQLRRLRDMAAPNPSAPLEQPFLLKLAERAGVETILALLKETPVLTVLCGRVEPRLNP